MSAVVARRAVVGGTAAVCLVLAGGSGARAQGTPGGDGWEKRNAGSYQAASSVPAQDTSGDCEFSLDGEAWAAAVKVDDLSLKPGADGKVHIQVRPAQGAADCTVSLASYRTHGPTWNTSGLQVFHHFDSASVTSGATDSLDISVPDAGCYAQVDLYRGSVKYDGRHGADDGFEHGDLPEGPGKPVIKEKNISWWNGGSRDCTAESTPTPSTTTTAPSTQEPTPSTTPEAGTSSATSVSPSDEAPAPSDTPDETPSSSETVPSDTPTPSVTPDASGGAAAPPASGDDLAETGGGNVTVIAGIAAGLLALGGGLVFLRRRNVNTRA
ncbi:LAETG motif-containing sortase-dependent surface protein [Streptomyces sp. NPDC016459]|uniref:LAETG motif-containing sortase-dependent surface protein n=1 Tax=Streptomyces sp. NPDC016459 TaxID=3157190 RepID=UPI0033F28BA3